MANIEVSRAAKYPPTIATTTANAMRSERPDGSGSASGASRLGRASTAAREAGLRDAGTQPSSARGPEALQCLAGRRELQPTDEPNLVNELDAELLEGATTSFDHERERVRRPRGARILDEVPVAGRDLRSADP